MSVIPSGKTDKISFFENHLAVWGTNAADIGLTSAQVTQIAALTNAARDAYNAAQAARNAALAATAAQDEAIDAMADYGSDLVKTIRAFAETESNPAVFATAQIPAPRPRTPLGPAPLPENLAAALTNAGEISLSWETTTRGRMAFVIERRTAEPGAAFGGWTLIGTSTTKNFLDETLPTGLESAQYRVYAERPGGRSQPTEPIAVLFGTGGQSGGELRIAA
ncbi:MAG: hypothetical protein AAFR96_03305 [Planctomycetota bacterium]